MLEVSQTNELRQTIANFKKEGQRIAFVPTMGNLHAGHLSLIEQAQQQADIVIASIFVNPLQFSPNEDYEQYPRTLKNDLALLKSQGCHLVYLPNESQILPVDPHQQTRVIVPKITDSLEGSQREGHFTGVATIVCKLFNLVQPDIACFGKKDYQQWRMIEKMVQDLNMNIQIIGCETVREPDGLALSSRNQYLTKKQRAIAPLLQRTLQQCVTDIQQQPEHTKRILQQATDRLNATGFQVNYLEVRSQHDLSIHSNSPDKVLLCAAKLGKTRLLDNLEFH